MVRWRYYNWPARSFSETTATLQTVSLGGTNYDVMRFATGQDASVTWPVDLAHNNAHLKPEWSLTFRTANSVATGVADWHAIDRASIPDGGGFLAPSHDNKLLHTVGAAGNLIWITPYIADQSVVVWQPGEFVPVRINRAAALDTIADSLDVFSLSMRYRIRG